MENIEVWQVYIFDGHSMHFSLAKNTITWSSTDEGFIRTRSHKLAMKQMIGEKVLSYMTKEKLRTDLKGTLPIDSFHYVHTLTY